MATQLQLRRGTTSETGSFTGAVGEVTVDTTKDTLVVHDGSTAGGHEVAKADGSNIEKLTKSGATKIATTTIGVDVTGTITADDEIKVTAASGYGRMEVGGPSGAFVDLKSPDSDDYDLRIKTTGTGGEIDTAAGEFVIKRGSATKLSTTSTGVDVTGTATMDGLTSNGTANGDTYFTGGTANARLLNVFTSTHDSSAHAGHNFKIASGAGAFIFGNNTTANLLTVKSGGVAVTGTATMDGLTVDGAITATTADNNPQITLISTDADANSGPVAKLYRNSASPADNDILGKVQFSGKDDAGNENTYALIQTTATDVSNGSENAKMDFYVAVNDNFAPSLTLENNNVSIPNGDLTVASGNGVFLGGTAAGNKLDDYEEGTWTPTLSFSSGSVTYGTRLGTYTKVGRQVTLQMSFGLSAVSSPSGIMSITGLPFTNASGEGFVTALNFGLIRFLNTEYNTVRGFLNNGQAIITLTTNATNANAVYLNANTLTANSIIYATLTYFA